MAASEHRRLPFHRYVRELGWRHLVGLLAVLFTLFPIVWIIGSSFNPTDTLTTARLIPKSPSFENYRELWNSELTPFKIWVWNSVKIGVIAAFLNLIMSAAAAYSFSRLRWTGRRAGLLTVLIVQMFPVFLAFVAIFLMFVQIGRIFPDFGTNTHNALVIVYLGGAIGFNTWLIKGFMDSIPFSLDESAKVDGASDWDIYWRIIMPLSRPVLAVIFIISFVGLYGEFILASIMLSSTAKFTYGVGLNLFIESDYAAKWGQLTAAAIVGSLPVLAVFLPAQGQIVKGLTQGAVKG